MRVHTYSLTYGQSVMISFYVMRLGANFTTREVYPVPTAILIVIIIVSSYNLLFSCDGHQEEGEVGE